MSLDSFCGNKAENEETQVRGNADENEEAQIRRNKKKNERGEAGLFRFNDPRTKETNIWHKEPQKTTLMKQPSLQERKDYLDIVDNAVSIVPIKGTKKSVKLRWLHPYTLERLTKLWIERDMASVKIKDGTDVMKDLFKEPYFAFKEAALMVLNNDIKIRLFYGIYWRWLAFRYSEDQMVDIVAEGKKKAPLTAHYEILAYSLDMRTDMMKMTKKEAEQYRAELLSEAKRLSSKISQNTGKQDGVYSSGNGITVIGAS